MTALLFDEEEAGWLLLLMTEASVRPLRVRDGVIRLLCWRWLFWVVVDNDEDDDDEDDDDDATAATSIVGTGTSTSIDNFDLSTT